MLRNDQNSGQKNYYFGGFSWVEVEKLLFNIYRPATHHGQHPTVLAVTSARPPGRVRAT